MRPVARSTPLTRKHKAEYFLLAMLASFALGIYMLYRRNFQFGFSMLGYSFTAAVLIVLTQMPTRCNVLTQKMAPCQRPVRGLLFGCHFHTWQRLLSMFGMRRKAVSAHVQRKIAAEEPNADQAALLSGVVARKREVVLYRVAILGLVVSTISMSTDVLGVIQDFL